MRITKGFVCFALLGILSFWGLENKTLKAQESVSFLGLKTLSEEFSKLVEQTIPALVFIETQISGRSMTGSGFLIHPSGLIATNHHVIEGAQNIKITTYDNRSFYAEIIGSHKDTDVALLKINQFHLEKLKTLEFEISQAPRLGQWVLALGAPFQFPRTATFGIISGVGRSRLFSESRLIQDYLQIDAAINPGNSGGPLLNMEGKVIAMNSAIYSNTKSFAGIALAIPSPIVYTVTQTLQEKKEIIYGSLGVETQDSWKNSNPMLSTIGVYVHYVESFSPAHLGGIRKGDIITHVQKVRVFTPSDLTQQILLRGKNTSLELTFIRDETSFSKKVTLSGQEPLPYCISYISKSLGFTFKKEEKGFVIDSLLENFALKGNIQKGDLWLGWKELNPKNTTYDELRNKCISWTKERPPLQWIFQKKEGPTFSFSWKKGWKWNFSSGNYNYSSSSLDTYSSSFSSSSSQNSSFFIENEIEN